MSPALYLELAQYAQKHPIFLHVKRKEWTKFAPKFIQFVGYVQATYNLYKKGYSVKDAAKTAALNNFNHTAFLFYSKEFDALYVFHNTRANSCHILPLEKYIKSINADIRADVLVDCTLNYNRLYNNIHTLNKTVTYSILAAIASFGWLKKKLNISSKSEQLCTQSIIVLLENSTMHKNKALEFGEYIQNEDNILNKKNNKITPRELAQSLHNRNNIITLVI